MIALLPRLSPVETGNLVRLAEQGKLTRKMASSMTLTAGRGIQWAATGGQKDLNAFNGICEKIHSIAEDCGWPGLNSDVARRKFDTEVTIALASTPALQSGESLRNDFWACLTLVGAPEIAVWRFPSAKESRLVGGVRNVYQRLWVRGVALQRDEAPEDRWMLVRRLSEDALVQIFERTSISCDSRLARGLAEAWVRAADKYGSSTMEDRMRVATRRIRVRNVIQGLGLLEESELAALLDSFFGTV